MSPLMLVSLDLWSHQQGYMLLTFIWSFAGYVGPGMLSAAVAGAVFTSPPPASILAAIRAIGSNNPGKTALCV